MLGDIQYKLKHIRVNPRIQFLLLVILTCYIDCFGQRWKLDRYEVHFGIGTTDIFGQIGGSATENNLYGLKDIRIGDTGPSFYLATRYKLTAETAVKLNLIYGHGDGSDAGSVNAVRDYSYSTNLFELSVQYEYYFLRDERKFRPSNLFNRRGMINNYSVVSSYLFLGAGGVYFDPKLHLNEKEYIINNQNKQVEFISGYSKLTPVIPVGVGIKMALSKTWSVGFELGRRFTFSSYLEGINTIYSKAKDTYYFGVFNLIYKLETDRNGIPIIFQRSRYY